MRAAVVVNPTKVSDREQLLALVTKRGADIGWEEPLELVTTLDDPGAGMARQAVDQGVDLVLSAGGDGTVMSVVTGLAGSGVPLGILPVGTGNLLARNLGLPLELESALDVAMGGRDRTIDLGAVGDRRFAVMVGIGFDAAMMDDAPDALKKRVGWPAYVVSGLRHVRDRGMVLGIQVDDGPRRTLTARTVLVGNVGTLQGGMELLPDAVPDDGVLDVVVVAPKHLLDWLRVAARVITRRRATDGELNRVRGRTVEIRTSVPQPWELDGDPCGTTRSLTVRIDPGALVVRVPKEETP